MRRLKNKSKIYISEKENSTTCDDMQFIKRSISEFTTMKEDESKQTFPGNTKRAKKVQRLFET